MMKRFLGVFLVLAVLISVAACGGKRLTTEELITQSMQNSSQATNVEAAMDMVMDLEVMGTRTSITTKATMTSFTQPMRMKMDMEMNMFGQNIPVAMYMEEQGDAFVVYTGTQGSWMKQTLSMEEYKNTLSQYDTQASLNLYVNSAKNFSSLGEETLDGKKVEKIQGVIPKEELNKVMLESGAMSQALQQSGGDLDEETQALLTAVFSELDDLPMTIWVDVESVLPVRYEMDMTPIMTKIFDSIISASGEAGADAGMLTVHAYTVAMDFKNYNGAAEYTLPDEAKNAVEMN